MSLDNVKAWIEQVEGALDRPGECVLYGGNTIKEALGDDVDPFLGARRLWLCQYGSTPVVPASWDHYWLWQYTDGAYGPEPHEVEGIGPCDINSYDGGDAQVLIDEWAAGHARPTPPPVYGRAVNIVVAAPEGVRVIVREVGPVTKATRRRRFR
jgi:lysozyme